MEIRIKRSPEAKNMAPVTVKADKGSELIIIVEDCSCDMDVGRIKIETKKFTIKEKKLVIEKS